MLDPGGMPLRIAIKALPLYLAAVASQICAQTLSVEAGAASHEAASKCGSAVMVHCDRPPALEVPPDDPSFAQAVQEAHRDLTQRRQGLRGDPEAAPDTIVITGQREHDEHEHRWEKFDDKVHRAKVPDCTDVLAAAPGGLLALIIVPMMAVTKKCL